MTRTTRPSATRVRSRVAVGLVVILGMNACGSNELEVDEPVTPVCAAGQIDGDLTLFNWPDYIDPEAITQFENRYGVTVFQFFYTSNESMLSQIEARKEPYDLIVPSEYMVDIMRRDGLLLPLDPIALPGRINLDPLFDNPPFDPDGAFSVPYLWGTFGIGVNLNVVGQGTEASWGLIFDPQSAGRFAGRISLLDSPRQAMAAALMYLGHSPNTVDRGEIADAAALIAGADSNLAGFQSDGYAEALADGALDVAHGRSDVFFDVFETDSSDYEYLIPREGTIAWVDAMAIPVTAQNPCTAHAFIDFILEVDNSADLANFTRYASPNLAASEFIDRVLLDNPAIYPPRQAIDTFEFLVDTGDLELVYVDEFFRAQG